MTPIILTCEQARKVDEIAIAKCGIPSLTLMETAGRKTADLIEEIGISGKIVICCGKGNNAGDGFVIARHLVSRNYSVETWVISNPLQLSKDAKINYDALCECDDRIFSYEQDPKRFEASLRHADWVVDALLGTGTQGAPREPYAGVIRKINRLSQRVFAVDVPSGLDVDTGEANDPTIQADHTATFVAMKQGFLNTSAKKQLGRVQVIDIGVPNWVLDEVQKL